MCTTAVAWRPRDRGMARSIFNKLAFAEFTIFWALYTAPPSSLPFPCPIRSKVPAHARTHTASSLLPTALYALIRCCFLALSFFVVGAAVPYKRAARANPQNPELPAWR